MFTSVQAYPAFMGSWLSSPMRRPSARLVSRIAALAVPLTVAAALVPVRTDFSDADAALITVVAVVAVASFGDRLGGILASASAAGWFDFFLTRPYERFAITRSQDVLTTVLLFVVGLAVTEITARGRRHRARAAEQTAYLDELHAIAGMMAEGGETQIALSRVEATLASLLNLRACYYEPTPPTGRSALVLRDGSVVLAGVRWPTLPGREVDLPIEYQSHSYGRFVLVPTPGTVVPLERRRVASALATDIGAILAATRSVSDG